jgi:hypothetical protein
MDLYSNYSYTGNKYLNDFIAEYSERKLKHSDYLQHYGVLGMKWGVRHDPDPTVGAANVLARMYQKNPKAMAKWDKRRKKQAERAKKDPKFMEKLEKLKKKEELRLKMQDMVDEAIKKAKKDKRYRQKLVNNINISGDQYTRDMANKEIQDIFRLAEQNENEALRSYATNTLSDWINEALYNSNPEYNQLHNEYMQIHPYS